MKLTSILIILLFAFVLAACGGGGGSSSTPEVPTTPEEPTEPEGPTAEEQAAADAAIMAANDAATAANAAAMAATDAVSAASLADTMAASDAATAATTAAQAATAAAAAVMAGDMATVDAANAAAMAANDAADAANMAASDLNMAEADAQEAEKQRIAAEQARIMGLTMAIADPDGDGNFPEGDELSTNKRPSATMTYEVGGDGEIKVGDDTLGKNDINIRNANEFSEKSEDRIDLTNFDVSVHERVNAKGATDTLTVYSDADEAGDEPFNEYFDNAAATASGDARVIPAGIDSIADATQDPETGKTVYNTITFGNDFSTVTKYISSSNIPTTPGTRLVQPSTIKNAQNQDVIVYTFSGSFFGVPGTYQCASACVISLANTPDATFTVVDGPGSTTNVVLTFKPTTTVNDTHDVHMVADVTPDTDYHSFGYWEQTSAKGVVSVGVFSGGSMPYAQATDGTFPTTALDALNGTATYEGSAAGLYARKEFSVTDGDVVGTPVAAGQFSADVELTANFGNTSTAGVVDAGHISANEMFTISGTVDNFQDASGDMISNWSMTLNSAHLRAGAADNSEYTGSFSGTTGKDTQGQWTGALFGDSTADTTAGENAATMYPSGITGEFTGHFTDGHVIGAFGATR